ncbi:hypothetical protein EV183_001361 [Coemansia sp. RSA 2336]|nr:hypothetical protein EV183_001361 [Coemansia sp. RSA 2336]
MNAFLLALQAAIAASGMALSSAESASSGCTLPLPLGGSISIAHLPFSISLPLRSQHNKREIELGNEEYMLSWWSSEDKVNGELFTEMSHALASSVEPLVVAPQPPLPSSQHTCSETESSSLDAAESSSLDAAESSSMSGLESRPLSIVEESGSPSSVQPAETSAAPSLVAAPAAGDTLCRTGMMRCTGDGGQFDTCLYGKWGTVRTCARGTRCVAVADDAIACAF